MKHLFAIIVFLCLHLDCYSQDSPGDILRKHIAALQSHESVTYIVNYIFKGSDRPDTLYFSAKANLQRYAADEIFGGKLRLAPLENANGFILYDLDRLYVLDRVNITGKSWDPHVDNSYSLKFNNDLIWRDFFHPDKLTEYLNKPAKATSLPDTTINGNACYKISIELPYPYSSNNYQVILSINKSDYMPILKELLIPNGETIQYTSFLLKSYDFNNISDEVFSPKQIPDFYKIKSLN